MNGTGNILMRTRPSFESDAVAPSAVLRATRSNDCAGTPTAIVAYLNKEMRAVLESPAFRDPIEAQGFEVLSSTPKEFEAVLRQDSEEMGALIKENDIKIE